MPSATTASRPCSGHSSSGSTAKQSCWLSRAPVSCTLPTESVTPPAQAAGARRRRARTMKNTARAMISASAAAPAAIIQPSRAKPAASAAPEAAGVGVGGGRVGSGVGEGVPGV